MRKIYILAINDKFKILKDNDNLDIIYDIFKKSLTSNFYQKQFNLMIAKDELNDLKDNLLNVFKERLNFSYYQNKLSFYNEYLKTNEYLIFKDNCLYLEFEETSQFYKHLNEINDSLIKIDLENEKVSLI